jgi:hypothetical protein
MQEMAEANARMVAADSWPFVQYGTGNLSEQGLPEIPLSLANQGVGPARLERLGLRYRDKPVASTSELLAARCFTKAADAAAVLGRNTADLASGIVTSPAAGIPSPNALPNARQTGCRTRNEGASRRRDPGGVRYLTPVSVPRYPRTE